MKFPKFNGLPSLQLSPFQAKYLCEGTGVFILTMTIALAEIQAGKSALDGIEKTRNLAPLASGFMLTALVFSFAYISGGHMNPAITVGVLFIQSIHITLAVPYLAAQVSGAIVGALFALLLSGDVTAFPAPQIYNNLTEYVFRGFAMEAILSGALVTVFMHVACGREKNNHNYGLSIGFYMLAALYSVGGIIGGSFNPAVATGLQLVKCFTGNCIPLMHLWLYWAAPSAGAVGAAVLFRMLHPRAPPPQVVAPPPESVY